MPSTYILKCADRSYYVGSTINLTGRIKDHLEGRCRYTKSRLPVKLAYSEKHQTLSEARKREYKIKKWKSRSAIERLIGLVV